MTSNDDNHHTSAVAAAASTGRPSSRYPHAGSLTMEKPPPTTTATKTTTPDIIKRRDDNGNVHLMEARLIELYISLRNLYRSNQELKEADPNDLDFIQAIQENWTTMTKQRELAMELVTEMKQRGVNIDIPDDISTMEIPIQGSSGSTATTVVASTTTTANNDDDNNESLRRRRQEEQERQTGVDGGIYL